ncbi:hypothetical protein E4U09_004203 [Claviceps aff. purpurea]|uniref:NADH-ubiquinone oxidoreductase B12 subunit n=1 Tax=Claviceps aff. purpurea TaxID=1967640 RepID=A0A9P7U4P5_9HYPO|nr:hypothetical protein E4U09_004203 [Claviceps aff. purpurea]
MARAPALRRHQQLCCSGQRRRDEPKTCRQLLRTTLHCDQASIETSPSPVNSPLRQGSPIDTMLPTRVLLAARGASSNITKASITGFDIKAYKNAAGQPRYDPWEKAEEWRYTAHFTRWNRFKNALPGLGTATVAFTGYCLYEHFFMEDEHHGEAHH